MDHQEATQLMAVEKYLLEELTPEARDKFEEHFFDCQECATDLRATAGFMDAARKEFQAHPMPKPLVAPKTTPLLAFFRPAVAWSALAASLLVIAYQNFVVVPRFQSEVAELRAPEILPSLSLAGGNSRGGEKPAVAVKAGQPFLLSLDIPTQDRFTSYTCLLSAPSGALVWRVEVSAQSAKDTVSIRVPSSHKPSGDYTLTVQGNVGTGSSQAPVDLAHNHFVVTSEN